MQSRGRQAPLKDKLMSRWVNWRRRGVDPSTSVPLKGHFLNLPVKLVTLPSVLSAPPIATTWMPCVGDLVKFLRPLGRAAAGAEVSLDAVGWKNIAKTQDRWPSELKFPPLFDEGLHVDEQLPRLLRVDILLLAFSAKQMLELAVA